MNSKTTLAILVLCAVAVVSAICIAEVTKRYPNQLGQSFTSDAQQRLRELEAAGAVPENAGLRDWQLAQKTTWWGKPIEPKSFWSNKVVWLDSVSQNAANRRGRTFPPMPFPDPAIPKYAKSGVPKTVELDSGGLIYEWTAEERAFWASFVVGHPRPPADIESKQLEIYEMIFNLNVPLPEKGPRITAMDVQAVRSLRVREAINQGYPSEAFSDDALLWTYVLAKREEYKKLISDAHPHPEPIINEFVSRTHLAKNLLTAPLSPDQVKKSKFWKIEYLKRLQQQNTDQTYLRAYTNVWNLNP